ncbi:hypothetical protein J5N97_009290 [Dioscorea zingiberensis]|uniref:Retrotransposon gag domain-containing protein n=1 Tax=Dioscorea zingiberensis TaxID=325984 RepID=A0A9D5CW38_9LILI|nr:hypothetical protein J5N97_009290 [Dioscorea zingiberensis]
MSDLERIRFTKMKLVGPAKRYWLKVEHDLANMDEPPITSWVEMRHKLKEKYLPTYHKRRLHTDWLNLRQGPSTNCEYMNRFEDLASRCGVQQKREQCDQIY